MTLLLSWFRLGFVPIITDWHKFVNRRVSNISEISNELIREARREYDRQWRKKNPEKVKAKNRRFWERKALEMMEQRKDGSNEH